MRWRNSHLGVWVSMAASMMLVSMAVLRPQAAHATTAPPSCSELIASGADDPGLSATGRFVTYTALAALPPPAYAWQVYLRDRTTGQTEMVSVSNTGVAADANSRAVSITPDGRYVLFSSDARNLGVTSTQYSYLYLRDRQAHTTTAIAPAVAWPGTMSGDGRFVAMYTSAQLVASDTDLAADVYVADLRVPSSPIFRRIDSASVGAIASGIADARLSDDGRLLVVTVWANSSTGPSPTDHVVLVSLSGAPPYTTINSARAGFPTADGSTVIFQSSSALIPGDTNGLTDIYSYDVASSALSQRVWARTGLLNISRNGRYAVVRDSLPNLGWTWTVVDTVTGAAGVGSFTGDGVTVLESTSTGGETVTDDGTETVLSSNQQQVWVSRPGGPGVVSVEPAVPQATSNATVHVTGVALPLSTTAYSLGTGVTIRSVSQTPNGVDLTVDVAADAPAFGHNVSVTGDNGCMRTRAGVFSVIDRHPHISRGVPFELTPGTDAALTLYVGNASSLASVDFGQGTSTTVVDAFPPAFDVIVRTNASAVSGPRSLSVTNQDGYSDTYEAGAVVSGQDASNPAATMPGGYHPLDPVRLLDTRLGLGIDHVGPIGADSTITLAVTGVGGVPADGRARAVVLNVTATEPTAASFLTVFPAGVARPSASNLNVERGQTVANLVIAAVGAGGGVSIYNHSGSTHVVADVAGWFGDDGAAFVPLTPTRLADTRTIPHALGPGEVLTLMADRGSTRPVGLVLSVTATASTAASYVSVFPGSGAPPLVSNLNVTPGQTMSNLVVVPVGADGTVSFLNSAGSTHLIVDVFAAFVDGADATDGTEFEASVPTRVLDTRRGGTAIGPDETRELLLAGKAVPDDAVAVVANLTVTNTTTETYVATWPSGAQRPTVSNLNPGAGETRPILVVVPLGDDGGIDIYNHSGWTDVLVDVVGWFR